MLIWNWQPGDIWASSRGDFAAAGVRHTGGRWAGFWTVMWTCPTSCGSSGPQKTKEHAFAAAEEAASRFAGSALA